MQRTFARLEQAEGEYILEILETSKYMDTIHDSKPSRKKQASWDIMR